jgi:hypothetical protein
MIIVLYTLISRGMRGNGGENPSESAAIRSVEWGRSEAERSGASVELG